MLETLGVKYYNRNERKPKLRVTEEKFWIQFSNEQFMRQKFYNIRESLALIWT
jgi:hypothetical protein